MRVLAVWISVLGGCGDHLTVKPAAADLHPRRSSRKRGTSTATPYYAHPDMFRTRATKFGPDKMRPMEDVPSVSALTAHGARVITTREAQPLLGGLAYVSGEIPRVTPFEQGLKGQHRRTLDGTGWELDELIMDERFVAVWVRDRGIVVLTACSHASVVNIMTHARTCFPGVPLYAVLGGLHLTGSNEKIIPETVAGLRELGVAVIAPGHCTGWRAVNAFAQAFGEHALAPLAVGKRLTFGA